MMNAMSAGSEPASFAETTPDGYQRIGDVARTFGVSLRTLRFYEDKGLVSPTRDGLTRLYSERDIARLKLVMLGRRIGFSLRDVKQIMDLYDPNSGNQRQSRILLEKSERQLARLERQRAEIDESISELRSLMTRVRGVGERKVA
jgi:DNA-binding transcriptional MerR regulator